MRDAVVSSRSGYPPVSSVQGFGARTTFGEGPHEMGSRVTTEAEITGNFMPAGIGLQREKSFESADRFAYPLSADPDSKSIREGELLYAWKNKPVGKQLGTIADTMAAQVFSALNGWSTGNAVNADHWAERSLQFIGVAKTPIDASIDGWDKAQGSGLSGLMAGSCTIRCGPVGVRAGDVITFQCPDPEPVGGGQRLLTPHPSQYTEHSSVVVPAGVPKNNFVTGVGKIMPYIVPLRQCALSRSLSTVALLAHTRFVDGGTGDTRIEEVVYRVDRSNTQSHSTEQALATEAAILSIAYNALCTFIALGVVAPVPAGDVMPRATEDMTEDIQAMAVLLGFFQADAFGGPHGWTDELLAGARSMVVKQCLRGHVPALRQPRDFAAPLAGARGPATSRFRRELANLISKPMNPLYDAVDRAVTARAEMTIGTVIRGAGPNERADVAIRFGGRT